MAKALSPVPANIPRLLARSEGRLRDVLSDLTAVKIARPAAGQCAAPEMERIVSCEAWITQITDMLRELRRP
jgi:hypothetical protein